MVKTQVPRGIYVDEGYVMVAPKTYGKSEPPPINTSKQTDQRNMYLYYLYSTRPHSKGGDLNVEEILEEKRARAENTFLRETTKIVPSAGVPIPGYMIEGKVAGVWRERGNIKVGILQTRPINPEEAMQIAEKEIEKYETETGVDLEIKGMSRQGDKYVIQIEGTGPAIQEERISSTITYTPEEAKHALREYAIQEGYAVRRLVVKGNEVQAVLERGGKTFGVSASLQRTLTAEDIKQTLESQGLKLVEVTKEGDEYIVSYIDSSKLEGTVEVPAMEETSSIITVPTLQKLEITEVKVPEVEMKSERSVEEFEGYEKYYEGLHKSADIVRGEPEPTPALQHRVKGTRIDEKRLSKIQRAVNKESFELKPEELTAGGVFTYNVWESSPFGLFTKAKPIPMGTYTDERKWAALGGQAGGELIWIGTGYVAGAGAGVILGGGIKGTKYGRLIGRLKYSSKGMQGFMNWAGRLKHSPKLVKFARGALKTSIVGFEAYKGVQKYQEGYSFPEIAVDIAGDIATLGAFEHGLKTTIASRARTEFAGKRSKIFIGESRGEPTVVEIDSGTLKPKPKPRSRVRLDFLRRHFANTKSRFFLGEAEQELIWKDESGVHVIKGKFPTLFDTKAGALSTKPKSIDLSTAKVVPKVGYRPTVFAPEKSAPLISKEWLQKEVAYLSSEKLPPQLYTTEKIVEKGTKIKTIEDIIKSSTATGEASGEGIVAIQEGKFALRTTTSLDEALRIAKVKQEFSGMASMALRKTESIAVNEALRASKTKIQFSNLMKNIKEGSGALSLSVGAVASGFGALEGTKLSEKENRIVEQKSSPETRIKIVQEVKPITDISVKEDIIQIPESKIDVKNIEGQIEFVVPKIKPFEINIQASLVSPTTTTTTSTKTTTKLKTSVKTTFKFPLALRLSKPKIPKKIEIPKPPLAPPLRFGLPKKRRRISRREPDFGKWERRLKTFEFNVSLFDKKLKNLDKALRGFKL